MTIEVVRYSPDLCSEWNALVRRSRNGLFQFDRGYMDYHSDRFPDFSAMAMRDGKLVALLPATKPEGGSHVVSHAGLTFGGFVLAPELRSEVALQCIDGMLDELKRWGAAELTVKLVPLPLCTYPSQDLEYALWRRGFTLVRRDLSSMIPLGSRLPVNEVKRRGQRKAEKLGLAVGGGQLRSFHALLSQVLGGRHGTTPVHSIEELELLTSRFSEHILLRTVERGGETLAGVLIYRYPTAWHTQYIAVSSEGGQVGALDLILIHLIEEAQRDGAQWLSFGISTTHQGRTLNEGLLWQKESFGARSVTHDFMRGTL